MSKLLTVFGATGQQGGSLIEYVLNHPNFAHMYKLRGITRNASKSVSVALREKGVDVVAADMDKPESLKNAVADSYAVFAVTQYWEKASASHEIAQGKAIADACVQAGVSLLIWSSLPSRGVAQFDSKAEVEAYIRTLPIRSSFFMPGWFMQNFRHPLAPKLIEDADGSSLILREKSWTPTTLVPLIDIRDLGKYLAPVLSDPDKYAHKNLTAATAFYTPEEIVTTWSKIAGKKIKFEQKPGDSGDRSIKASGEAEDSNTPKKSSEWFYYGPSGRKDLKWTLAQMSEKPKTWEDFLKENWPWS